jgi:glycolate oxidase iron-sulfur subunit
MSITREEAITRLASRCVHCGFCLSACPTYQVTAMENDSPRGRIWLMANAARTGEVSDVVRTHLDRCIGCEACVPACPSGVRYDQMLELGRQLANRGRSAADALWRRGAVEAFSRVQTLGPVAERAAGLARLIPPIARGTRVGALVTQARSVQLRRVAVHSRIVEGERARVSLLAGCIAQVAFGATNRDTVEVLAAEGISVLVPRQQSCCGALAWHAGYARSARRMALRVMEQLDGPRVEAIVVNSAGCGSVMKRYPELFEDGTPERSAAERFSAKVRDVSELLDEFPSVARYRPLGEPVAYHDACHLVFAQGVRAAPRRVLSRLPGLELQPAQGLNCCGSGGLYSLFEPELAAAVGARKVEALRDGPRVVLSGNPGCTLQLARMLPPGREVIHPVTLLARQLEQA